MNILKDIFGIGKEGENSANVIASNKGNQLLQAQGSMAGDPALAELLAKAGRGEISISDAIKASQHNNSGKKAELQKALEAAQGHLRNIQGGIDVGGAAKGAGLGAVIGNAIPGYGIGGAMLGGLFGSDNSEAEDAAKAHIADLERQMNELGTDEELNRSRAHQFYIDPQTGTLAATEQVQNNPMLSGMFGKGGLNDRMMDEEKDLASRGWSMKPEDYEAYGEASDEAARLSGQEEASLANMLASRGLAAAPSGAAGVGFSGIAGNKFERLASAQRKIANDRMNMNLQRLNSVRDFAMKGNQLAQSAIQDQFGRNRDGINDYQASLQNSLAAAQAQQGQENAAFAQREATRGPSLGEVVQSVAGAGLGAAAGGLGTGAGSALGQGLGNAMSKGMVSDKPMYGPRKKDGSF